MLNNLKSNLILKKIFCYPEEKVRLNIIKYNKTIQNKLNIDIEKYKKVSGIRRNILKNGEIKEYSLATKKLIYNGGFNNKKKNGKGKEFDLDTGYLIYEGDYINGEKNGFGKELIFIVIKID